jgi:deoxyribodipyrimidine photo-lyase
MDTRPLNMFPAEYSEILARVEAIDPVRYGRTRNFLDGAVTRLAPYISRGVISTRFVMERVFERGFRFHDIEKFIQELAWRDYYQNVWRVKQDMIGRDLRQPQPDVANTAMPKAVLDATTGITAIDDAINGLFATGYVHNHARMYIASVTCNVAKSHWLLPAKWFYYHLHDADWASNACSWQWVAAAFSGKKYYANQENINKYCGTDQRGTFLDVDYAEFPEMEIPDVLRELAVPQLETDLPAKTSISIDPKLPTLIYNFYNLDPTWRRGERANRVLLLEPSHFERYPVSQKTIEFILKLAQNIENIQVYTGEFDELKAEHGISDVYFKEHPTNLHYAGKADERDWMFPEVRGYFPSFFGFWKRCERLLKASI